MHELVHTIFFLVQIIILRLFDYDIMYKHTYSRPYKKNYRFASQYCTVQ